MPGHDTVESVDEWTETRRLFLAGQTGDRASYRGALNRLAAWYAGRSSVEREAGLEDFLGTVHQSRHTYRPERDLETWADAIRRRAQRDPAVFGRSGPRTERTPPGARTD